jgi:hypothetical protein
VYPGDGQQQPNWHQQPSSYQGLGYYQEPPPPRKRGNLALILTIAALVVVIGAVVTIVLVTQNSGDDQAQTPPPGGATTSKSTPKFTPPRATSKDGNAPLEPQNAGWSVIKNEKAALYYEVPPSWTPVPSGSLKSKTLPNVTLSSPASLADYQCQGGNYSRGGLGAGVMPKSDPSKAATDLAKAFGAEFYASGTATVEVSTPKAVTAKTTTGRSLRAFQVDATVTISGNACLATKGKVSVLVIDNQHEYQFLVVNGDVTGGPATPPPPPEPDLQKIVESARSY